MYRNYRYSLFVTNLTLSVKAAWNLYRERSDAENRIKEFEEGFGMDSFNVKELFTTEAALNCVIIATSL